MAIEDRVKKVLLSNTLKEVSPKDLAFDSVLIDYGVGLDSVATLELVVALEEEFKIQIDESEITSDTFETIETISTHIKKSL